MKPRWLNLPISDPDDFRTFYEFAGRLIDGASKEDVAEAARLLALNVAHYKLKYGALPLENFADMFRTESIDPETAKLLSAGMQSLVGSLGQVLGLDDGSGVDSVH